MCDCNLYLNYLGSTQERYCMSCPSLWSQKISTPTTRRIYTRSSKGQAVSNDKICKAKCVTKTGISSGMGFGRGEGGRWECRKGQQKKDVERVWICSGTTEFLGH